ncbi:hypothetical protein QBC40DRAFT_91366 [Triangularia verruculosa]|uniref:C2H2-type domain-containing protein n=1 Tax=Triangularia verruculosa TaxID=2587418 RepID=A0AAN6XQ49_9PEZI|nr:hypothetical protein QBC40DRAFT_91366 [Triangularia verruculosa]
MNCQSFSFNTPDSDHQYPDSTEQSLLPLMPDDFPVDDTAQQTIVYPLPISATEPLKHTNPAKSNVRYTIIDGDFKCLFIADDGSECRGSRLYKLPGELRKHQKNHRKPTVCDICQKGFAEKKDVDRHKLKYHSDDPSVRSDKRVQKHKVRCSILGCPYRARPDNVKRHQDNVHR